MLPSNIARKQKNYLWAVFFFLWHRRWHYHWRGRCLAELRTFFDESIRKKKNKGLWKKKRELKKNKRQLKRPERP